MNLSILAAVLAVIQLIAPKQGDTVPVVTDQQRSFINMDPVERKAKFRDKEQRPSIIGTINKQASKGRLSCWPAETKFEWKAAEGNEYTVKVMRKSDKAVHFEETVKGGSVMVDNLDSNTEYIWTVTGGGDSGSSSFKTEDIEITVHRFPGVPNVRDIGGAKGLDGLRIRQGLMFRSFAPSCQPKYTFYTQKEVDELKLEQKVDKNGKKQRVMKSREPTKSTISPAGVAYIEKRFGIKTDIDLRNDAETYGLTNSPFGANCKWEHHTYGAYTLTPRAFAKIFKLLLDENNYPVDFHCYAGQDRTGTLAYVLEGLLGASEDHLLLDYQMTGFWNPGIGNSTSSYEKMQKDYAKKYPDMSYIQAIEKDVMRLGFTMDDINKYRSIMLDGYKAK